MRWVLVVVTVALIAGGVGAQGQSLMQTIRAERYRYEPGDKILFEYTIRNMGNQTAVYNFPTSKQYDIWISRGGEEVFRLSKNRLYMQVTTTIALRPGESKSFYATWDQTDLKGKQVEPGIYTVNAQLTPSRGQPDAAYSTLELGAGATAPIPIVIRQAIGSFSDYVGRSVVITAFYRGSSPDPGDPNTKDGPPVSKSDRAICDECCCLYVVGATDISQAVGPDGKVTVIGRLERSPKGQVYLMLEMVAGQKKTDGTPGAKLY
jgi:hypothetical protein